MLNKYVHLIHRILYTTESANAMIGLQLKLGNMAYKQNKTK